ncbi:tRNA (adenosine(37)-N6)-threonylcarbamoyltransferase complex ATPase subunit type 1 TsaE [Pleionea sediminis]|uniref:tRNA (adenosine(37)-N6)-threonylcarbamoyltransferase complex ATPase subunit type 1 TsaE n=1 Tax=Pleionea sediminis TaxID=2569479 RepID=UPI001186B26A|nr:tRNA (adenosine(37)-N6)-threonylcarbamoyltransferase complex ATPase subunit type 1 TsaE [Pleionea sediminis]
MYSASRKLLGSEQTEALGAELGRALNGKGLVFLKGDLGAGKTTLARGLLRGLGFGGSIKSPTYTLVEPYEFGEYRVYHFDLYRLADPEELEFIGVDEYFSDSGALLLVEWPEKGTGWLPEPHITLELRYDNSHRVAEMFSSQQSLIQTMQVD